MQSPSPVNCLDCIFFLPCVHKQGYVIILCVIILATLI